jgi:hypothetical protein
MPFVKKTQAQINAMTDAEAEVYAAEKEAHEAAENKAVIDEAVRKGVETLKTELETKITEKNQEIETLKETVETQGTKIVEMSKGTSETKMESLENIFKEKYEAAVSGEAHTVKEGFSIDTSKAIASTDVMSVDTINSTDFPAAGSTGVVGAGVKTLMGKLLGYFGYRSPASKILDLVDVQPMDSATLIVINETVTGTAEITTECKLKPIVKESFVTQEKSAEAVAVMWFTTTKLRRFFPALVNRMIQKFGELVNDKLPNVVLDAVKAGASAFTPDAALAINTNPNNYDAMGAVIATIENLGFNVTAFMMNPIAWRNMKQEKTADGVYTLQNGQSVNILQNGLDWGGVYIPIIKDPKLGVDEFVTGDIFSTVKVGVDSILMYMETDGRTDAVATNAATGLSRNIRTHVLEKFFAVIIPDATKIGLVKDTFTNVKTLITATP